jgi:hypothetical protein
MAKKRDFSNLHWEGDPPSMTEAIDRFMKACLPVYRPSEYQLKIDGVNFYPSTGTVQIDGQSKQQGTGINEVFRILQKSDPAFKYPKRRSQPEKNEQESLPTIELVGRV